MKHYFEAFKLYAQFSGRATRTQYWWFILFNTMVYIGFLILDTSVSGDQDVTFFSSVYTLAALIPSLAILARRIHDGGNSGWWVLVLFIPILGFLCLLVLALLPSTEVESLPRTESRNQSSSETLDEAVKNPKYYH